MEILTVTVLLFSILTALMSDTQIRKSVVYSRQHGLCISQQYQISMQVEIQGGSEEYNIIDARADVSSGYESLKGSDRERERERQRQRQRQRQRHNL